MTYVRSRNSGWARRPRLAVAATVVVVMGTGGAAVAQGGTEETITPAALSKYMNSIPPSNDFFCVGTGPTQRALHPDRAPHTRLAEQNGVILFSGTAPQQGLNFELTVGSLVYRNQMSTLGSPEPSPQVGTAGTLLERPWEYNLPWSEARWHPGEDITWQGYRVSNDWMEGLPHFDFGNTSVGGSHQRLYESTCGVEMPVNVYDPQRSGSLEGGLFGLEVAFNLQLARGVHQASMIRPKENETVAGLCPFEFREPWFQARGVDPVFNLALTTPATQTSTSQDLRLAEHYYPTFHNIYTYQQLELDGGRLLVDFERSANWPREPEVFTNSGGTVRPFSIAGGEFAGMQMARTVRDEYGNRVYFDRVPKYGWETDYKVPYRSQLHDTTGDPSFMTVPPGYRAAPNAWRLPHKRLRTVQLFDADDPGNVNDFDPDWPGADPSWTIAFIYEHPESDRITGQDVPVYMSPMSSPLALMSDRWKAMRSLYSYLPQADWDFGRLPDLNDETTLLTVQAYRREAVGNTYINGAEFRDDMSVWQSTIATSSAALAATVTRAFTAVDFYGSKLYEGDVNVNGCPGVCGQDDDLDGKSDEDCANRAPGAPGYGANCPDSNRDGVPDFIEDDNEDSVIAGPAGPVHRFFSGSGGQTSNRATDPPESADLDGCPGECDVDDDGDGLIDEDTNNYLPYLTTGSASCLECQLAVLNGDSSNSQCVLPNGLPKQTNDPTEDSNDSNCRNPMYWRYENGAYTTPMDPFAVYDDDEDGLIDEDGWDDPLLVNLRGAVDNDACGAGRDPYVPGSASMPLRLGVSRPAGLTDCVPPLAADFDPWTYQVQYVYARSNPYWLLMGRDQNGARFPRSTPVYYYHPPFTEPFDDTNSNGSRESAEPFVDINRNRAFDSFDGATAGLPNVHPDCLPSPRFRGPQGKAGGADVEPLAPSDIHLIKRIVRVRPDPNEPRDFTERTWLYRYNDIGFLKAVFDPASVQALIDADENDGIGEADDILKYSDTHIVAGKPLILYASQWYTYYNPYVEPVLSGQNVSGIPPCYERPPVVAPCDNTYDLDSSDPNNYLPLNACDGETLWQNGYHDELHIDPDCSDFVRQDCGWCFARYACGSRPCLNGRTDPACVCDGHRSYREDELRQLGIPDAQPRFRKYQIKTARVRGNDGEMQLFRFDYLGAATSAYGTDTHITSYADAHNIAIVDRLAEQTPEEQASSAAQNEFYIYEDDFRLDLDPAPQRAALPAGNYTATSHHLYVPVKVKTRRVVVMNYYGIAISDRLILTPGFKGDVTALVDDQQYELTNMRGQTKHLYDPSWVAGLRERGFNFIRNEGRVLVELFGGKGGWYSVLRGIAQGSGGGNLYDQQCATPEVISEVPVQRVRKQQLTLLGATQHWQQGQSTPSDLPAIEATYYRQTTVSEVEGAQLTVSDPAGTLGGLPYDNGCVATPANEPCVCGTPSCEETPSSSGTCTRQRHLPDVDLHKQEPVSVTFSSPADESGDGVSLVRHHYEFHDLAETQVKRKWRWQEAVPVEQGGTGKGGLEVWYFDQSGRLRLYGRGAGLSINPPTPSDPFLITYFGYDSLGRPTLEVEDVVPIQAGLGKWGGDDVDTDSGSIHRIYGNSTETERVTFSEYDDAGMLVARSVGRVSNPSPASEAWVWNSRTRTEYAYIANRKIVCEPLNDPVHKYVKWEDPFSYRIEYQAVELPEPGQEGKRVHGTTTVDVFDKAGKFVEQRVIGWGPEPGAADRQDMIPDFGWGVSLADYTYDGAIAAWGTEPGSKYWESNAGGQPGDCVGTASQLAEQLMPPPYGSAPSYTFTPPATDHIVTLARTFKRYEQRSTLKPTHEIAFNDFMQPPPSGGGTDRRQVVRQFSYDLEDRIARQQDPDGTITRLLFDPKRRPTKVFRGSRDGCSDWFPRVYSGSDDDMMLVEHRLYNDGKLCQYTDAFDPSVCDQSGPNDDFPYDANKLVRIRRYTDAAEACTGYYDPSTRSHDTQIDYDWRGRPVISREIAVGYGNGGDKVVSVTTMVYDNLDRPTLVAVWDADSAPLLSQVRGWQETTVEYALFQILSRSSAPLSLSQTLYDERGRVYEQRTYDPSFAGQRYTFTKTYRDDLDRVTAELTPNGLTCHTYDSLGRVTSTSFYAKEDPNAPGTGSSADELTRTVMVHDYFGNVLTQSHYERKAGTGGGPDLPGNAIITYTCNWYDPALRLVATANFGTNTGSGYPSSTTPPSCDPRVPPRWTAGTGATNPGYFSVAGATNDVSPPQVQVTRYGYDAAGRRIWTQDSNGVVSRTWYDLMGHVLLEAENWKDDENLAPSGDSDSSGTGVAALNPQHSGQVRYTAYHYTRGGVQDMIAAVIPQPENAAIEPEDIVWDEDPAADYAATGVAVPGLATVQATRFVLGADVVAERGASSDPRTVISKAPAQVAEIRYPIATGTDAGQPSTTDAVQYKFTLSGHVAQRTDQRGVTLDYDYGTCDQCLSGD
ncbi:MAG: RHS repeat protein, partial [Planctomycetes bacterium]|nr:RHS repeat protein [Planctomycetota bacterium]